MAEPTTQGSLLPDVKAASAAIRAAIAEADGPLPPHFVVEFLLSQWRRYLALSHHRHGSESPEWKQAVNATRELLFSVLPITSVEQRTKLARSLPGLVLNIKQGAEQGAIDRTARDLFLKQLGEYHIQRLDPNRPLDPISASNMSDTISMDVRDPRFRALMDRLDGASGVEHIEM